jgi:hypothetical protein
MRVVKTTHLQTSPADRRRANSSTTRVKARGITVSFFADVGRVLDEQYFFVSDGVQCKILTRSPATPSGAVLDLAVPSPVKNS